MQTFSGRNPSQHPEEIRGFIDLLLERGVTRYLEIGARHGDTFHEVMCHLPKGSTGVAVDLPGGLWGMKKSKQYLKDAVADLNRRGYKCTTLFGNSQTAATQRLIVGRGPYDAVLIDGDHTLVGVTKDWNRYQNIAPLVAFHDIVGTGEFEKVHGNRVEVPILWRSLKDQYRHYEFVAKDSVMGIGVLCSST